VSITEIDFDRLMEATQTVIRLKAGAVLSAEDVADIQYAFECERQHEDDAVDAYSKGYSHGVLVAGGADKACLMETVEALKTQLAVANALNRYWQATTPADAHSVGTERDSAECTKSPDPKS